MKKDEIFLRDPYVLVHENKYYMYGTRSETAWNKQEDVSKLGFDVYISDDLENWSEPIEVFRHPGDFWSNMNFWAPEVHVYQDKFYLFATFNAEGKNKGTQILVADHPEGPFRIHTEEPLTPREWPCLDGTLYVDEAGTPYMIFCHEWIDGGKGTICSIELSSDLKEAVSEPKVLLHAVDVKWHHPDTERFVTDGPFMYTTTSGKLLMMWSSLRGDQYVQAIAESESGTIEGPWIHQEDLFYYADGGHGMLFKDKENRLVYTYHSPNSKYSEHPHFYEVQDTGDTLLLKEEM